MHDKELPGHVKAPELFIWQILFFSSDFDFAKGLSFSQNSLYLQQTVLKPVAKAPLGNCDVIISAQKTHLETC